jgi:hypothetical protein
MEKRCQINERQHISLQYIKKAIKNPNNYRAISVAMSRLYATGRILLRLNIKKIKKKNKLVLEQEEHITIIILS